MTSAPTPSQSLSPTPASLRALFFAVPASAREFAPGSRDLRDATVVVGGERVRLGDLAALEVEALTAATRGTGYSVKYFDPALSRAGKRSVVSRRFTDRAEAERFASTRTLYSKPAVVSEVLP